MRIIIYPYRIYSRSARLLRDALGALLVYPDRNYRPRATDVIINWGNSIVPNWYSQDVADNMLNTPHAVGRASNKLTAFRTLEEADVATVDFTTDREEVSRWGACVVRNVLQGHSGEGIEIIDRIGVPIPVAPLYTRLIQNSGEYRVHVFNGEVIDYAKKRRYRDDEPEGETEEIVRTNSNGWIFTRDHLRRLERIEDLAIDAIEALGLDFGAVDIIKDENGDVFVLEVNTAMGMTETTQETYTNAIRNYATRG